MKENLKYTRLNYLEEIANGDNEFKKELINIFLKQVPEFIFNMKKYFKEDNNEALAREAHTAKSSVIIFMMDETGEILKQIQLQAKIGEKENIPALIDKVEEKLIKATEELSSYLTKSE
jgi:HPt (histidine-containing phosphotransfer) domain-containing protein